MRRRRRTHTTRARALLPSDSDFLKGRAAAYLLFSLVDPADKDLQAALKIKNDDAQAWYQAATVFEARGQIQDAIDALDKASTYAEETHQDELTALARYRMGMMMQRGALPQVTATPAGPPRRKRNCYDSDSSCYRRCGQHGPLPHPEYAQTGGYDADRGPLRAIACPVRGQRRGLPRRRGLEPPPNEPDLDRLLADYDGELDAAFIITPHAYHHDQTVACMEAGLDVLLEKPMVMNAAEACSLIEARDRTGRLLVVAFPGSLSPQIRAAAAHAATAASSAASGASARRRGRTGAS